MTSECGDTSSPRKHTKHKHNGSILASAGSVCSRMGRVAAGGDVRPKILFKVDNLDICQDANKPCQDFVSDVRACQTVFEK